MAWLNSKGPAGAYESQHFKQGNSSDSNINVG